jgi:hypothetical protein
MMNRKFRIDTFCRHHPRKRMIQYSVTSVDFLDRRGVRDARLRGHDDE